MQKIFCAGCLGLSQGSETHLGEQAGHTARYHSVGGLHSGLSLGGWHFGTVPKTRAPNEPCAAVVIAAMGDGSIDQSNQF